MKVWGGILTYLLLLPASWLSAQCIGLNSPEPTCTEVFANGDVEVDFDVSVIGGVPTDIDSFLLEFSPDAVSWSLGGFIDVAGAWPVPTLTHLGAMAHTNDRFYRIIAVCVGSPTTHLVPSSVIKAVRLQSNVTNDFEVNLSWNWDGLSTGVGVTVNRKLPYTAAWSPIALPAFVQGNMNLTDTVVSCADTIHYQIDLSNPTKGCLSKSSIAIETVLDQTPPDVPVIDTITFDPALNKPVVTWNVNPKTDTWGYVVLYYPNNDCNTGRLVDTVYGRTNTSVIDNLWYAGNESAQYAVYAFDNCSPGPNSISQRSGCANSIQLETSIDVCDKSIRLDWTAYTDFASGTDVLYKIFVSIAGSNFVYVDSSTKQFYIHTDPVEDNILTYKVVAFENGGAGPKTVTSNMVDVNAEFLRKPDYSYLRYATVEAENYVRLEMFTDIDNDVGTYHLKRAADSNDVFTTVNIYHAPEIKIPADSIVVFSDRSPITDKYNYYYKVDMYDTCGSYMTSSNFISTMLLRIEVDNVRRVNRLEWTNVNGWAGKVFEYKVHRFLDGTPLKDPITVFPDSAVTTVFYDSLLLINDNITKGNPSKGEYTYYVEAREDEPTFKGVATATSYSNEVTVIQQPYISTPNAFSPNGDGRNEYFNPTVIYHDVVSYEFYVMNRYGEIIYQTSNVKASWDGTFKGEPSPQGVYVYDVRYKSSTGEQFQKRGTVALVR